MKFICKTFSWMDVIFQDESNEPSSIIIDYSYVIVIILKSSIMRSSGVHWRSCCCWAAVRRATGGVNAMAWLCSK